MKKSFLGSLVGAMLLSCVASAGSTQLEVRIENVLRVMGLKSYWNAQVRTTLGSVTVIANVDAIDQLCVRLGANISSRYVVQVTGRLAQNLQTSLTALGMHVRAEGDVLYIFGRGAERIVRDLQDRFTVAQVGLLNNREFVVVTGPEAAGIIEALEQKWDDYFGSTPDQAKTLYTAATQDAQEWALTFLADMYEDIAGSIIFNPVKPTEVLDGTHDLVSDVNRAGWDGVQRASARAGDVWVFSFDTIGKFLAFLSGAETNPDSVALRRSGSLLGESGYHGLYTVSNAAASAKDLVVNPFVSISMVSDACGDATLTAEAVRDGSVNLAVGYVVENIELLGTLANYVGENPVGNGFIWVAEKTDQTGHLGGDSVGMLVRFTGTGVQAIVGLLNPLTSIDVKVASLRTVRDNFVADLLRFRDDFLRLLGLDE